MVLGAAEWEMWMRRWKQEIDKHFGLVAVKSG
jgi:hypothetical protein